MNEDQVRNLLKYIDASQDESTKREIFTQLGHDCFRSNRVDSWVEAFQGDVQKFLDNINIQHRSEYWESLVFSADNSQLILTGKEVDRCACPFAGGSAPPLSLCNYCCRSFQKEICSCLFGRVVEVTITESYLWGDERCSTIIHIGN
jgi:hypothetical protein